MKTPEKLSLLQFVMIYSVHVEQTLQPCHETIYDTRENWISDELIANLTKVLKTNYEIKK